LEEEKAPEPEKKESADTLQKGDLAYLDFDLFIVRPDENELYDTTREESAKENDIFDEKKVYAEVPFIVGQSRFLPGLDEALEGAEIGKDLTVDVPPDKGAGERDPKLVEVRSVREFARMEIEPEVGKEVLIKNKVGTITQVGAGRVRVDFNNPLAGFDVKYNCKVTRKAQTQDEKIKGILDMDYGSSEEFGLNVQGDVVEILLPDVCKYDEKWFIAKYKVVSDLREIADFKLIKFVEEYEKKEVKEEKEEPEEAGEETLSEEAATGEPPEEVPKESGETQVQVDPDEPSGDES
jgi:FKBP-type peptidyl-prolyl cis-trans isomerase 2